MAVVARPVLDDLDELSPTLNGWDRATASHNTVVVDDPFVSTEQAVLSFRGRAWYVEDLDSTNGTFVNGARIDGLAMVAFGDELQLGRVRFRLERAG